MDDAAAKVFLHGFLRCAGTFRWPFCRRISQRAGDAGDQHHQSNRLCDDVAVSIRCSLRYHPGYRCDACLWGRRPWRRGLFTREIRDSHGATATGKIGYRQRLDRGTDGILNHRWHCRRWDAAEWPGVARLAWI